MVGGEKVALNGHLPVHWMHDYVMQKLSDHAWRAHDVLIMWTLSNGTDGVFPPDVADFAPKVTKDALNELYRAGLIQEREGEWLLVRYEESQSSAAKIQASLENRRKADRVRQARKREREKQELERQEKELGVKDERNKRRDMSRDNHVTVGKQPFSNRLSRDNNVTVVMLNADDDKEIENPLKNESTQQNFNTSEDVSGVGWSGSFDDLPDDADAATAEMPPAGAPRSCAEPGCDTAPFGNQPLCFAHNQQKIQGAA